MEYKIISRDVILEYIDKKDKGSKIDPFRLGIREQFDTLVEVLKDMGKKGWIYVETLQNIGYIFVRYSTKDKYEYKVMKYSEMIGDAKSKEQVIDNLQDALNKEAKEGWEYCEVAYLVSLSPLILMARKVSGTAVGKDSSKKS